MSSILNFDIRVGFLATLHEVLTSTQESCSPGRPVWSRAVSFRHNCEQISSLASLLPLPSASSMVTVSLWSRTSTRGQTPARRQFTSDQHVTVCKR